MRTKIHTHTRKDNKVFNLFFQILSSSKILFFFFMSEQLDDRITWTREFQKRPEFSHVNTFPFVDDNFDDAHDVYEELMAIVDSNQVRYVTGLDLSYLSMELSTFDRLKEILGDFKYIKRLNLSGIQVLNKREFVNAAQLLNQIRGFAYLEVLLLEELNFVDIKKMGQHLASLPKLSALHMNRSTFSTNNFYDWMAHKDTINRIHLKHLYLSRIRVINEYGDHTHDAFRFFDILNYYTHLRTFEFKDNHISKYYQWQYIMQIVQQLHRPLIEYLNLSGNIVVHSIDTEDELMSSKSITDDNDMSDTYEDYIHTHGVQTFQDSSSNHSEDEDDRFLHRQSRDHVSKNKNIKVRNRQSTSKRTNKKSRTSARALSVHPRKHLNHYFNQEPTAIFVSLKNLSRLRVLKLCRVFPEYLEDGGKNLWQTLAKLKRLQTLNLSENMFNQFTYLSMFNILKGHASLHNLFFDEHSQIDEHDVMKHFSDWLVSLHSLKFVSLNNTYISIHSLRKIIRRLENRERDNTIELDLSYYQNTDMDKIKPTYLDNLYKKYRIGILLNPSDDDVK